MTDTVITVENLRKTYRVGDGTSGGYRLLRDLIADSARRIIARAPPPQPSRVHHALDGISLTVERGEVLGIIGANGAGKSTLLKILSRITEPTAGRCTVKGRIGALLEVGTGFNPELTGRENVYVNGTILGMSRREIQRKFDEIVDFAGIASYIDTPVKRYSSGMQVRLAFAVAAHLEPEIMVVDEVLAVGDIAFQRRCLGRMNDVARKGRTVLLVSHNMEPMLGLCSRVMWLDQGRVQMIGPPAKVVQSYLAQTLDRSRAGQGWPPAERRHGNGVFRLTGLRLLGADDRPVDPMTVGQGVTFEISYRAAPAGRQNVSIWLWLLTTEGKQVTGFASRMQGIDFNDLPAQGILRCHVPKFSIGPGTYVVNLAATIGPQTTDQVGQALVFDVVPGDFFNSGTTYSQDVAFLCDHHWVALGKGDIVARDSATLEN